MTTTTEHDDDHHPPDRDRAIAMLERVAARYSGDPPTADEWRWFAEACRALYEGEAGSIDEALGLAGGSRSATTQARLRERDRLLRIAAAEIAPRATPWKQAVTLEHRIAELGRSDQPIDDCAILLTAAAQRHPLPTSAPGIYAVLEGRAS